MTTISLSEVESGARRWRISADEFELMASAGVFGEDDPVELLDGELFEMAPTGDWHTSGVTALTDLLANRETVVQAQSSLRLDDASMPEPDIALVRRRADYYRDSGVRPADVVLLVEVADTSARYDRETKLPLYARAGIPEVWIVTRQPAAVEVYRRPSGERYLELTTFDRDAAISPAGLPGVSIRVRDVTG